MGIEKIGLFLEEEAAFAEVEGPGFAVFVGEIDRGDGKGRGVKVGKDDACVGFDMEDGGFAAGENGVLFFFAFEVVAVVGIK